MLKPLTRGVLVILSITGVALGSGCSSKSMQAAAPMPDAGGGSASTFTAGQVDALRLECGDPDAGLMGTADGIFSPEDFCALYLATCTGANNSYGDLSMCLSGYEASANLPDGDQQHCRSYHVCNASFFDPPRVVLHCGHAAGILLCN